MRFGSEPREPTWTVTTNNMDAQDVLNRILNDPSLTNEKQKLIERLKEGQRQLDEGDNVEFDEEGLRRFFDELIERAQKRSDSK